MSKLNLAIDMGYRGECDLTIKFIDQNCQTHEQTLAFRVFGEKPTCFTVGLIRDDEDRYLIHSTTSEYIALRTDAMPINQRIRIEADRIWEIGKLINKSPFDAGQTLKALASELHQVARRMENP